MAVLVEGISVIVRKDRIDLRFTGGWHAFLRLVPNRTLCHDGELARVGFMSPGEVEAFIGDLVAGGLEFLVDGSACDLAVVDQQRGPAINVSWLQFAHVGIGRDPARKIAACWLFENSGDQGYGIYMHGISMSIAKPEAWEYETSLSARFVFVETTGIEEDAQ
jgi:hypothetical protein